jgi:hypothetical protein
MIALVFSGIAGIASGIAIGNAWVVGLGIVATVFGAVAARKGRGTS